MNEAKDLNGSNDLSGGALRGVAIGCGVLVAVPVLLVLGFLITYSVQRGTPEEYERVAPEEMAGRMADISRELSEVAGFEPPARADFEPGPNSGNDASCYPGGLESIADEPVEGAYSLSDEWSVDGVTEADARSAMKRLHRHLKDEGWDIDAYDRFDGTYRPAETAGSAEELTLRASREGPSDDGGGTRLVFEWRDDQQRFRGVVVSPCAYDPEPEPDADVDAAL